MLRFATAVGALTVWMNVMNDVFNWKVPSRSLFVMVLSITCILYLPSHSSLVIFPIIPIAICLTLFWRRLTGEYQQDFIVDEEVRPGAPARQRVPTRARTYSLPDALSALRSFPATAMPGSRTRSSSDRVLEDRGD